MNKKQSEYQFSDCALPPLSRFADLLGAAGVTLGILEADARAYSVP
jgi:hypothetical protein